MCIHPSMAVFTHQYVSGSFIWEEFQLPTLTEDLVKEQTVCGNILIIVT
jgi:hypothetical protein